MKATHRAGMLAIPPLRFMVPMRGRRTAEAHHEPPLARPSATLPLNLYSPESS
jgi:hypothetical protein